MFRAHTNIWNNAVNEKMITGDTSPVIETERMYPNDFECHWAAHSALDLVYNPYSVNICYQHPLLYLLRSTELMAVINCPK